MTIFISDTHLGNRHSHAFSLLCWLTNQPKNQDIYLIGDIIDDHQMKEWGYSHHKALLMMFRFHHVYYTPGNHDPWLRGLLPFKYQNIIANHSFAYRATNGKRYLVTHGDKFDWLLKYSLGLSSRQVGDTIRYWANSFHSWVTGNPYKLIAHTKALGYDGVITGHTHEPIIDHIEGIDYINCGDWVHNCSAIIDRDGKFELVIFDVFNQKSYCNHQELHPAI